MGTEADFFVRELGRLSRQNEGPPLLEDAARLLQGFDSPGNADAVGPTRNPSSS